MYYDAIHGYTARRLDKNLRTRYIDGFTDGSIESVKKDLRRRVRKPSLWSKGKVEIYTQNDEVIIRNARTLLSK